MRGIPQPLALWIVGHDEASNFLAFAVLGTLAFWAEAGWRRRQTPGALARVPPRLSDRAFRLGLLLCFIAGVELAQVFIPGRVCDVRDILAGWCGIGVGWLAWRSTGRAAPMLAGELGPEPASAAPQPAALE